MPYFRRTVQEGYDSARNVRSDLSNMEHGRHWLYREESGIDPFAVSSIIAGANKGNGFSKLILGRIAAAETEAWQRSEIEANALDKRSNKNEPYTDAATMDAYWNTLDALVELHLSPEQPQPDQRAPADTQH